MMKYSFFALALFLLSFPVLGQQHGSEDGNIFISGIAEMAFEPDYLIVALQNRESQKSGSDRNITARKERTLIETLKGLGIDTTLLAVRRFAVSEYPSVFKGDRLGLDKTYTLRIDDIAHYEDIMLAISKTGFDFSWITKLGVNDVARKEAQVITAALEAGKAKVAVMEAFVASSVESPVARQKLRLAGIEEMPNNYRYDQDSRPESRERVQGLSIGGGSYSSPVNLGLDKVIIRKAFLMRYRMW